MTESDPIAPDRIRPDPHEPGRFDAVLLASFGGPNGPDDVLPFLERVTAGRGIPPERLLEVGAHYLAMGGISPLPAQNLALVSALCDEFARRGLSQPVYLGNRNSAPYFVDVLRRIHQDGHRRILAVSTSAYSSYSGCRQYREDLGTALAESGLGSALDVVKVRPYADRPGFLSPMAADLASVLDGLADTDGPCHVFFTTHSIPDAMAMASGPEPSSSPASGLYVRQHLRAAERIIEMTAERLGRDVPWSLAYQSRSGPPQVPWLEPDINDALREAASGGVRTAVLVPIGFISDHVEVVWDLDTQACQTAAELGLGFHRVATAGVATAFVSALADLVEEASGTTTLEHDEPWARMCGTGCCVNPRSDRPVVQGC